MHSKDSISDTTLCVVHQSQENQTPRHDPCHFAAFCHLTLFVYPEAPLGQCLFFEHTTNLCLCLPSSFSFFLCFTLSVSHIAGRPDFVAVAQSFALFTFLWNHKVKNKSGGKLQLQNSTPEEQRKVHIDLEKFILKPLYKLYILNFCCRQEISSELPVEADLITVVFFPGKTKSKVSSRRLQILFIFIAV